MKFFISNFCPNKAKPSDNVPNGQIQEQNALFISKERLIAAKKTTSPAGCIRSKNPFAIQDFRATNALIGRNASTPAGLDTSWTAFGSEYALTKRINWIPMNTVIRTKRICTPLRHTYVVLYFSPSLLTVASLLIVDIDSSKLDYILSKEFKM